MVLPKRVFAVPEPGASLNGLTSLTSHPSPATPLMQKDLMTKVDYDRTAGLLDELTQLLQYAGEIFEGIVQETQKTSEGMKNLSQRVDTLSSMPCLHKVENYLDSKDVQFFVSNPRETEFMSRNTHSAQLFVKDASSNSYSICKEDAAVKRLYESANPPPDFSALDEYGEGEGSCLAKYTNPNYFITEWLSQQKKERKMLLKRQERRKGCDKGTLAGFSIPSASSAAQQQRVVTKLLKTRYNRDGEKIVIHGEEQVAQSSTPSQVVATVRAVGQATRSKVSKEAPTMRIPSRSPPRLPSPRAVIPPPIVEPSPTPPTTPAPPPSTPSPLEETIAAPLAGPPPPPPPCQHAVVGVVSVVSVVPNSPPAVAPRSSLLEEIRGQKSRPKEIKIPERIKRADEDDLGGNIIAVMLRRRIDIIGSDSENEEEDGFDDDDEWK